MAGNFSTKIIPETFDDFIVSHREILETLTFTHDPATQTYRIYQKDKDANESDILVTQNYDADSEMYSPALLSVAIFNILKKGLEQKGVKLERLPEEQDERDAYASTLFRNNFSMDPNNTVLTENIKKPSMNYLMFFEWMAKYPDVVYRFFSHANPSSHLLMLQILHQLNPDHVDTLVKKAFTQLTKNSNSELEVSPIETYENSDMAILVLSYCLFGKEEFIQAIQEPKLRSCLLNFLIYSRYPQEIKHKCIAQITLCGVEPESLNELAAVEHYYVYTVLQAASQKINLTEKAVLKLFAYWLRGGEETDTIDFNHSVNKLIFKILNRQINLSAPTWTEITPESVLMELLGDMLKASSFDEGNQVVHRQQWQNNNNLQKVLNYLMQHSNNHTAFLDICFNVLNFILNSEKPILMLARQFFQFIATSSAVNEQLENNGFREKINELYEKYDILLQRKGLTSNETAAYKEWLGIVDTRARPAPVNLPTPLSHPV